MGSGDQKKPPKPPNFCWPEPHSELSMDCLFIWFQLVSMTILKWKLVSLSLFFWAQAGEGENERGSGGLKQPPEAKKFEMA